jgi:hypothetical protein
MTFVAFGRTLAFAGGFKISASSKSPIANPSINVLGWIN